MSESIISYPRKPGSSSVVTEKEWNQDAPFGHCPACGSIGMEEIPIPGDPEITFFCPDPKCLTVMGSRDPARTKWFTKKSRDLLDKESKGLFWNKEHFPDQDIPFTCPD